MIDRITMVVVPILLLISTLAGLAVPGSVSNGVGAVATTDKEEICQIGYARAHRSEYYGGLAPRRGCERDHVVPLCLGGADSRENIKYQPLGEAQKKDRLEWWACRSVCEGHLSLDSGQAMFLGDWRNSYREVFGEEPLIGAVARSGCG